DSNIAARKFYKYENLAGMNINKINALSPEQILTEMEMAKSEKRNFFNFRHVLADGTERHVEVFSYPIKFEDQTLLFSIINDVTDKVIAEKKLSSRNKLIIILTSLGLIIQTIFIILLFLLIKRIREEKKKTTLSEKKLKTLFSSMSEVVVIHDLVFDNNENAVNYRITDCNSAFTNVTGITREQAVGRLATEVYGQDEAPYLEEYAEVAISGKAQTYIKYFQPLDKHFKISVISAEKNTFATVASDITEITQINQTIIEKNKELEHYLYIASHDLRSPLVNIQGFSQRMKKNIQEVRELTENTERQPQLDKILNEKIPNTLNYIFSGVEKIDTLLNGLLEVSRTGRAQLKIDKIDMNNLISSILDASNFQLHELRAIITTDNLDNCHGDETLLNCLFSNIISNAIKYHNPERTLKINISSKKSYKKVTYSVSDNGIGIKEEEIEKIWEIFYRASNTESHQGEGLGLSIAKRIVEKHNGRIWIESEFEKGTTIFIELKAED
ncbi:MAG: PAS domain S-box protein, partial [Spirochaetales bacterium]|nr:PAS domain S-box protein [Spirochaetales bacterium]